MITSRMAICLGLRTTVSVRLIPAPAGTSWDCTENKVDEVEQPKRSAYRAEAPLRFVLCSEDRGLLDITDRVHAWSEHSIP